jgi:hypothetical protein
MSSPSTLHASASHVPTSTSSASIAAANASPHWQQQLIKAEVR